jgi:hypothetical protein
MEGWKMEDGKMEKGKREEGNIGKMIQLTKIEPFMPGF